MFLGEIQVSSIYHVHNDVQSALKHHFPGDFSSSRFSSEFCHPRTNISKNFEYFGFVSNKETEADFSYSIMVVLLSI